MKVRTKIILIATFIFSFYESMIKSSAPFFTKIGNIFINWAIYIAAVYIGFFLLILMIAGVIYAVVEAFRQEFGSSSRRSYFDIVSSFTSSNNARQREAERQAMYEQRKAADRAVWERTQRANKAKFHEYQSKKYAGTKDGEYHKNMSNYYKYKK